ncbi:SDR family NAD(P)-dependent oxidoreductase [Shewanella sp. AS16]|uniref:SDR family NAD(P)-dependent oxidoreductase n=1 Tax=Shewanella sp. AS16 TaxID=2907625 RepID=UPI001F2A575C|nr:SDR family NAD(P)-dependent oxidoreductase [Shewanella sp. AS16]MCE9687652.1 SDR family NAD(P)-dependent oxidoreductase [Shewanella sp. AS16]
MILITGASSGLGAALARHYDQDGQAVVITGRNRERLRRVADGLSAGTQAKAAELTDPVQVGDLLDGLARPPKTVIHCAGSGYFGPLESQTPDAIRALLDNNVTSTILLIQALVQRYKEQQLKLVVVMSTAAQVAKAGESTYCAAKWAVRGFIESMRLELKGSPMKLIAVYPGGMATEFWETSGKSLDTSGFMSADEAATMLKQALQSSEHGYISDIGISRG